MNTKAINPNLLPRLRDKKYRDMFIASHINKIIPFQIRTLRAARNNMTQEELAERAETTQSVISRIQNRGAANLNIKSLLKLASAFDVALVVRFEPIDKFIDWVDDLSPEVMSPKPSELVLAEAEHEASELEKDGASIEPAITGRVVLDAGHFFPGLPENSTAARVQFLPLEYAEGSFPAAVSKTNKREAQVKREVIPATNALKRGAAEQQTLTRKIAGGING